MRDEEEEDEVVVTAEGQIPPATPVAARLALAQLLHDAPMLFGGADRLLDDCVPSSFAETASPVASSVAGASLIAPSGAAGAGSSESMGGSGGAAPAAAAVANGVGPSAAPSADSGAAVPAAPQQQQQQQQQRHRKRKERHESIGSAQERKVVRSNSEERPLENGVTRSKETIRRVSSHEDFSSVRPNQKHHHHHKSKHHHHHHHHHHHNSKAQENEGSSMSIGDGENTNAASGNASSNCTTTSTTATSASANNSTSSQSKSFLSEVIDTNMGHGVRMSGHGMPLHERNESKMVSDSQTQQLSSGERDEEELVEDSEHERRRNSERFARASGMSRGRRNMGRRRRPAYVKSAPSSTAAVEDTDGGSSSKENEEQDCSVSRSPHQMQASLSSDEEGNSSRSSSSHSFLQLHPQEQDRVPSPEPSPSIVGGPPPLDLSTLHQQVGGVEPLTSRATWSREGVEHEEMIANSRVMLSPRNSLILSRRVYLDTNMAQSPPHERDSVAVQIAQARLKQLGKQMSSMKKKLKRLEEEFEKEYGYRPSHAEKSTNKEMKKISTELSKIRKEMKQLKEDPHNAEIESQTETTSKNPNKSSTHTMEDALQEVEQHLADKRKQGGRPEAVEDLSREQLLEEKVAVQKALLHLEDMYGRPVTKGDRDLVRPLYDRYRTLKRMVVRTAPSKMKDSISELATIHEHETMDFTSSPPPLAVADDNSLDASVASASASVSALASASAPVAAPDVVSASSPPPSSMSLSDSSETLWKNLHSLSLSELLSQQRSTKEEKKRLRRSLREFEEDFQLRTGKKLQREDRLPMEGIYSSYKQAKAKLRLLEALVSKVTT